MRDRDREKPPQTSRVDTDAGTLGEAAAVGLGAGAIAFGAADAAGLDPKYSAVVGAAAGTASLAGGVVARTIQPLRRKASEAELATREGIRRWLLDLDEAAKAQTDVAEWSSATPAIYDTLEKYIADAAAYEDDALEAALRRLRDELTRLRDFRKPKLPDDWPALMLGAVLATNVDARGALIVEDPTFTQRFLGVLHLRRGNKVPA